ncbi:D-glycero-beta-D-manno-heptose-7-phosphate kinase [candidate division TA06 bacterium]|nr:D-glycero-beta-D-manno-heptose-7-phosphate kinase [candidate division TA06 bacterium]
MSPSKSRSLKILSGFKGKKVLVIGDLMLDRYLWGAVSRISPEAPVPVVEVFKETVSLGGAANVTKNLADLGGRPLLVGVIGNDSTGRIFKEELRHLGLESEGVFVEKGRPTTLKTRIIAHHQHVVRVDRETRNHLDEKLRRKILQFIHSQIPQVDGVLFEDYDKGVLDSKMIEEIIAYSKGKTITADPKQNHFFAYKGVTLFKPNQREVEQIFARKLETDGVVHEILQEIQKRLSGSAILLTRGEKGMAILDGNTLSTIPATAKEVFDVTGAGDTVIATSTLALLAGANVREAAWISNQAAGIEVGKLGAASVTLQELETVIV